MKKFITTLLIAIMAFTFMPFIDTADGNAYAATSLISKYNLNQIDAPKTVYVDVSTRGEGNSKIDTLTAFSTVPENIYQMLMDLDKDYDGFLQKNNLSDVYAFAQINIKVDDNPWIGTWEQHAGNPIDFDQRDDSSMYYPWTTYTPERMSSCTITDANKDNDAHEHDYWNGIYASQGNLDLKNHKISFKIRWGVSYTENGENQPKQYVYSNTWKEWSIGKNGTQAKPVKPKKIPAAVISKLRTETSVSGAVVRYTQEFPKEMDSYQMYCDINTKSIGTLQGQIRVNGGTWKDYHIVNSQWWTNGEREISISSTDVPFKKGDSIEFRMRISGGAFGNSEWSNILFLGAKAKLAKYNAITCEWEPVEGVNDYHVYIKKETDKAYPAQFTTVAKDKTSVTFEKLTPGKKYNIKVVPTYINATGELKEGELFFQAKETTLKKVTGLKVVKSKKNVKVSWGAVANADGYQLYQSTSKKGSTSKGFVATKSKTLTAKKGKNLFYKVRAYKVVDGKKIYAPVSDVKAFKLK